MKDLLIIRSAGFQQLDMNIGVIEEQYKNFNIQMLTHEHGVKLAKKYKSITNVYVYPYKEGFHFKNKVEELKDKTFDVVIIPVTNISGVGFLNVFLFSLSLKAKKRVVCNLVSDIWEISKPQIYWMAIKSIIFSFLSLIFTIIFGFFSAIILIFLFRNIKKKGS